MALACRTIEAALDQPTMHNLATHFGGMQPVIIQAAAIIEKGMEYFGARRMTIAQVSIFAEEIATQFRHETLADLNVFLRKSAMSTYDGGEFYSTVDIPRLSKWWTLYLGDKADERERVERQRAKTLTAGTLTAISSNKMIEGLNQIITNRNADQNERSTIARREKLLGHIPQMSDDELREAWRLYPNERSYIQAAAARRGLLGDELKAAQLQHDAK